MAVVALPPAVVAPDPAPGARRPSRLVGRGYVCTVVVRAGRLRVVSCRVLY